jgi:O-succinylbenzoate synthase
VFLFKDLEKEVLSIYFCKYVLVPQKPLNAKSVMGASRIGHLLRFLFKETGFGYCDFFVWEELGETPSDLQLKFLKNQKYYSDHLKKCLYFAKIDSIYRQKSKNIFFDFKNVFNHYTCVDIEELSLSYLELLKEQGFSCVKIKVGLNLKKEILSIKNFASFFLEHNFKLRLDFNSSLDFLDLKEFLFHLEDSIKIVDFLEDPMKFNFLDWYKILKNHSHLKLALDHVFDENILGLSLKPFEFLIVKPALNYSNTFLKKILEENFFKIIFTSYMDHPFGQLCALFQASSFYEMTGDFSLKCGFLTHHLYEKNKYSETFSLKNTQLLPSLEGTGFGFDHFLEREDWKNINGY